jgi:hypothetical protein
MNHTKQESHERRRGVLLSKVFLNADQADRTDEEPDLILLSDPALILSFRVIRG